MDLNRWGITNLSHLYQLSFRFRGLRDHLAQVLEGERSLLSESNLEAVSAPSFSVQNDFEALLPMGARVSESLEQGVENIFRELAPYFEAGFCLKQVATNETHLVSMFLMGRVFESDRASSEVRAEFHLPQIAVGAVAKGRSEPVLRSLDLAKLPSLQDGSAFAFRPTEKIFFVVVCTRPHPWQVGAIESANHVICSLVESLEVRSSRRPRSLRKWISGSVNENGLD